MDTAGKALGPHHGIENFTIGQRKGIGIAAPKPYYVVALDAEKNRVVVGNNDDLLTSEFVANDVRWIPFDAPSGSVECEVKIRHNHHNGAPATVTPLERNRVRVKLHEPQRAVTPGQAAVFYQEELVLGGGWISHS